MVLAGKPIMTVIAGPNGSGKTSMFEEMLKQRLTGDIPFINADIIAKQEFGDWNDPEAQRKASIRAGRMREDFIKNKKSLMYETILTRIDFIHRAKANGFHVDLFYVSTSNPSINIERIAARVAKGGHHIPDEKVIERYGESLKMCLDACTVVDRAFVYDNSVYGKKQADFLFRVYDGRVKALYQKAFPEWASNVLHQLPWDFDVVPG